MRDVLIPRDATRTNVAAKRVSTRRPGAPATFWRWRSMVALALCIALTEVSARISAQPAHPLSGSMPRFSLLSPLHLWAVLRYSSWGIGSTLSLLAVLVMAELTNTWGFHTVRTVRSPSAGIRALWQFLERHQGAVNAFPRGAALLFGTAGSAGMPSAASEHAQALDQCATGDQPRVSGVRYEASVRTPRTSRVRHALESAAGGSTPSEIGVTSDSTALQQAEEALRQSEERFSKAFHASPIAMAILSRTTRRILDANKAEFQLTGYSRDELLGATMAELGLLAPTDLDTLRELWRQEARVHEVPIRVRMKSGEIRLCRTSTETIWIGSEECLIMTTRDVTAHERAEEALRAATAAAEAARREEERRRHEAERREQIAESLREVLAILNSNHQVTTILDHITRQAGRLLSSDAAAIYTMDASATQSEAPRVRSPSPACADSGHLTLQAAFGLPSPLSATANDHHLAAGHAAVRRAMVARRPVAVLALPDTVPSRTRTAVPEEDIEKDMEDGTKKDVMEPLEQMERIERIERIESGEQVGRNAEARADHLVVRDDPLFTPYRALLAIPIIVQGTVYGGLLLLYTALRRFSDDEIALAMAYGDQIALAVANARLQDHIERAAIETERNRLARELHDTVTQEIFIASVLAESIPRVWEQHRTEAEENLRHLHQLTRGALAALRALLLELHPAVLEQRTLEDLLRQLGEAMTTRSGVTIALAIEDGCPPIPSAVKVAFYRIAQEALTNAAKHAHARTITVRLRYLQAANALQLEIRDDGQGFETSAIPPGHFGMSMMRERAHAVGARLRIKSRHEQGTHVTVQWAKNRRMVPATQA